MRHIGIDLSKGTFSVVVLHDEGEVEFPQAYVMDEEGIGAFVSFVRKDDQGS